MGNKQKLNPNTKYVLVTHMDGSTKYYEVYNPSAYIDKCNKDGKSAVYAGETDSNGNLK